MSYDKIVEIISTNMDIDPDTISENSTFESLKIDSLDMVEIVMELEEAFDISIDDSEDLKTVGDLAKYIDDQSN